MPLLTRLETSHSLRWGHQESKSQGLHKCCTIGIGTPQCTSSKPSSEESKIGKTHKHHQFQRRRWKNHASVSSRIGLAAFHDSQVLLIDMDHQSSLSITCLGPDKWQEAVDESRTVDEVFRPFISPSALPGEEIIIKSPMKGSWTDHGYQRRNNNKMDIAPASLLLDDTEIELTASTSR